jgi:hypothetical protein
MMSRMLCAYIFISIYILRSARDGDIYDMRYVHDKNRGRWNVVPSPKKKERRNQCKQT